MNLPLSASGVPAMAVAQACAARAREIIRGAFGDGPAISVKGNRNIVTETDVAVERAVHEILAREVPEHAILSEETAADTRSGGWMWVCDPVDGTKNFAQGIPHFAFSIALCHDEVPRLGLTLHPLLDWEFRAERGGGCWLNERRVTVSGRASLAESVVSVDLGFDDLRGGQQLDLSRALWTKVQGIRTSSSAALGFAFAAAGKWDAYIHRQLSPWDSAAGIVLVEEAGGAVSDLEGNPASIYSEAVVCGTPAVQRELRLLAERVSGRA